jgi:hypothetical protein
MPVMLNELEPGVGQGKDSESTTGRLKNSNLLRASLRNRQKSSSIIRALARGTQARWILLIRIDRDDLFPARPPCPGESRCPHDSDRRRRRIPAHWPLSVAVIAVTGAVKAVTGDGTAVTRSRDPCAGRDRHRAAVTTVAGGLQRSSDRLAKVALSRNARSQSRSLCAALVATPA